MNNTIVGTCYIHTGYIHKRYIFTIGTCRDT